MPGLSRYAPVKLPSHMAEQLRLEERLGHAGAVDGDKRPAGAVAERVDLPRNHLLSGAALAGDEDLGIGSRDTIDLLPEIADDRTDAD